MAWGYENDYGHSGYSSTPAGKNKGNDAKQNTALTAAGEAFLRNMMNNIVNDDRYSGLRSSLYTGTAKDEIDKYLANTGDHNPGTIVEIQQKMAVQGSMLHNGTQHFRGDWSDQPTGVEDTHRENTVYDYNLSVDSNGDYSAILASLGLSSDYSFQSSDTLNDNLQSKLRSTSHAANTALDNANKALENAKKAGEVTEASGAGKYQKDIDAAKKGVADARNEFMDFYHESMVNQLVNEMAYTQQVALSTLASKDDGISSENGQSALYQYAYSTLRLSRLDGEMVDAEHIEQAKAIIKAADPSVNFEKLGKQIDDELVAQMHEDVKELLKDHGRSDTYNDTKWLTEIKAGTYNLDEALLQRFDSADLSTDLVAAEKEREAQALVQAENDKLEAYFMAQGTKASAEDIDKAWNELDADTQKKLSENLVGRDNYLGPTYNIPYGTPGESSALSAARTFAEGAVGGDYGSSGHWKYELEQSLKNGDAYQLGVPGSSVSKIADKYLSDEDIKAAFNNPACTEAILESYGECAANSAISDTHKDATEQIWKYLPDDKKKELEDSLQGPPDGKYVFKLSKSDVYDSDGESIEPDVEALRADYYDELYRYAKAHDDSELASKAAKNLSDERVTSANTWLEENKDYDWTKSQFDADYEPPAKTETKETETKTETKETAAAAKEVEIPDAQVPLGASAPESKWTAEKIEALYAEAGDDRTKIAQLDYQMATEVWKGNIGTGDDRKALLGDQYERIQLCAINNVANGTMTAWAQPGTDEYNKLIENLAVDGAAYDICDGKDIDLDDLTKQGLDDNAVLAACDKWQGKDSNQAAVEQIEKSETKPADEKQTPTGKTEPEAATDRKQIQTPTTTSTDNKPERTERVSFADMDGEHQEKFFGAACKSYAEKCGWDLSSPEAFRAGHYEVDAADFSAFMDETAKAQGIIYDMDYLSAFTDEAAKDYSNTLPKSSVIAAYATFSDKDYDTNYVLDDLRAYAGDLYYGMDDKSQDKFFGAACKSYADKYGWDLSSPEAYQAGKYTLDNDNFLACVEEVAKEQNIVYNNETFADTRPDEVAAYAAYAAKDYAGDVSDLFKTYVSLPDDSNTADTGWDMQGGFSGGSGFTVGSASLEAAAAKYTTPTTSTTPTTPQTEAGLQAGG